MKCPRCGKQSTEYDENKWQCLTCSNKFVYKEESPTYQSQTNVSIQGSSLFDVEPWEMTNERSLMEPYFNLHPQELVDLKRKKNWGPGSIIAASAAIVFLGMVSITCILHDALAAASICIGVFIGIGALVIMLSTKRDREIRGEIESLRRKKIPIGWITLCPACKEEHSRYRNEEKDPTSGPVHCKSCGKQFMLLEGKSHVIKR